MQIHDRHRLERHARRIEELRLWRNAYESRVKGWRFVAGDGKGTTSSPATSGPRSASRFGSRPARTSPRSGRVSPWSWSSGSGARGSSRSRSESRRSAGGLNPFHRSFPVLDEARGGEEVGIEAEVVSKGMFGSNVSEPRLERARLVGPGDGDAGAGAGPHGSLRGLRRSRRPRGRAAVARRARRRDRRSLHRPGRPRRT